MYPKSQLAKSEGSARNFKKKKKEGSGGRLLILSNKWLKN